VKGDVGTKLIFENDRVKVWEFTLQPGEAVGEHTHHHDYLILPIEGSMVEVTRGDQVEASEYAGGSVIYRPKGETHNAKNVGSRRYHQLIVELKE
jgi:quercetin dioxygenase-like cupin family protein